MSGHSHYATIKRQKSLKDAAKGAIFSKMARAIQIAVKEGGGGDPDSNYKLRMAVDAARGVNMPRENIDRAISRGVDSGQALERIMYEGFGPNGIGILVEVATDNRNRTAQEIKNVFEKNGGTFAGPGSVSFNFSHTGQVLVEKANDIQNQILTLMDIPGIEDVEELEDFVSVYTDAAKVSEVADEVKSKSFKVGAMKLIQKPKSFIEITDKSVLERALSFLEKIEEHDDVQEVYTNLSFPDNLA